MSQKKKELEKEVEELELDLKSAKLKKELSDINSQDSLKMNWFKFYIYWQPWITTLLTTALAIQAMSLDRILSGEILKNYQTYYLLAILVNLAYIFFQFTVANKVSNRSPDGAKILKTKLLLGIIIPVIDLFLMSVFLFETTDSQGILEATTTSISTILTSVVIYFASIKYFNKRLFKFNVDEDFKF